MNLYRSASILATENIYLVLITMWLLINRSKEILCKEFYHRINVWHCVHYLTLAKQSLKLSNTFNAKQTVVLRKWYKIKKNMEYCLLIGEVLIAAA